MNTESETGKSNIRDAQTAPESKTAGSKAVTKEFQVERVCASGSDGSPSCGHGEWHFDGISCRYMPPIFKPDDAEERCNHSCTFPDSERVERHERPLCCRHAIAVQDDPVFEGKQLSCGCGNRYEFKDAAWRMISPFAHRPSPRKTPMANDSNAAEQWQVERAQKRCSNAAPQPVAGALPEREIYASNDTEVIVSGSLLVIQPCGRPKEAITAVLTHDNARTLIGKLNAAHDLAATPAETWLIGLADCLDEPYNREPNGDIHLSKKVADQICGMLRSVRSTVTPSRDDEEVARQTVETARVKCGVGTIPRIFREALEVEFSATLAANRNALIGVVKAARSARLKVPIEYLVESKRQAFAAGAEAIYDEIIESLRKE